MTRRDLAAPTTTAGAAPTLTRADRDALTQLLTGRRGPRHSRALALCGGNPARAGRLIAIYDALAARPVAELPVLGVRPGRVIHPRTRTTA
jgi:hypothetical protein